MRWFCFGAPFCLLLGIIFVVGGFECCRIFFLYHVKLMPLNYFIALYGEIDTEVFLQ